MMKSRFSGLLVFEPFLYLLEVEEVALVIEIMVEAAKAVIMDTYCAETEQLVDDWGRYNICKSLQPVMLQTRTTKS